MRAAVLETPGTDPTVVDDVDIRDPRHGEVKVRIAYCSLCHSDLSVVDGVFPAPMPIVLGHEASGVVDSVGPGVEGLEPGDPVVLSAVPPCGRCAFCLEGDSALCVRSHGIVTNTFADGTTGLSRRGETVYRGIGLGGFAEWVVVPETGAVKIPADMALHVACVVGCAVQTGVGAAINTARVREGSSVLVMGLGGIGLSIVQGARLAGASRIVVSDPDADRRGVALGFGATDTVDPAADDVVAACMDMTGIGIDYAFDAVGRSSLVETAVAAVRPGGTAVMVGALAVDDPVTLAPAALIMLQEKKLIGTCLGSCNPLRDIPKFLDLYRSGRLELDAMVTAVRPLEEIHLACADMRDAKGIRTALEIAP